MFSLQTIFGKGDKIYGLLEASADAARQSSRALITMLNQKSSSPSLDEFRVARRREKEIMNQISQTLVNTFVTALDREDIEALSGALYKIPKTIEKFAERYALFASQLMDIDYASRAQLLEKATAVIVEMVDAAEERHEARGNEGAQRPHAGDRERSGPPHPRFVRRPVQEHERSRRGCSCARICSSCSKKRSTVAAMPATSSTPSS